MSAAQNPHTVVQSEKGLTVIMPYNVALLLASFPGLPHFFFLWFAFSIIHGGVEEHFVYKTEHKPKNKKKRRG